MNFRLAEEQTMLREAARGFLAKECPPELVRSAQKNETESAPELWPAISRLGWTALGLPEEVGGSGDLVDLAVLFEETGRALLPAPLLSTLVLGGRPLARSSSPLARDLLAKIASGDLVATAALHEESSEHDPSRPETRGVRDGAGFRLSGEKIFVPDAGIADGFLVLAAAESGAAEAFWVERETSGVEVERIPTLDWGRQWIVRLEDVRVPGEARIEGFDLGRLLDEAATLHAAEMVGAMERTMELAVEWAKTRIQFGRPIGSFQAVSHRCADMLVSVEAARSLVYYACVALEEGRRDATGAASAAKAFASDAFPKVAEACLQIHGGMGYTWEHDVHLYLRRAKASEVRFGDAAWHHERLLQALGW